MTTKLVQKSLLKGRQEFEIIDDAVNVLIKTPLNEERLTVMLAVLNSEPVIGKSTLDFTSRVNNEPLLSLRLGQPNAEEFNAFVNELKQRAHAEFNEFAGIKRSPTGIERNVYEEPPEFGDDNPGPVSGGKPVRVEDVKVSIQMLRDYLTDDDLSALIEALTALEQEPDNPAHFARMASEFEALGPRQGAVLTYAPYIGVLLSDDPMGF